MYQDLSISRISLLCSFYLYSRIVFIACYHRWKLLQSNRLVFFTYWWYLAYTHKKRIINCKLDHYFLSYKKVCRFEFAFLHVDTKRNFHLCGQQLKSIINISKNYKSNITIRLLLCVTLHISFCKLLAAKY